MTESKPVKTESANISKAAFILSMILNAMLIVMCGFLTHYNAALEYRNQELRTKLYEYKVQYEGWRRVPGLPRPIPPEPK